MQKYDIPLEYSAENVPYIRILVIGDTNTGKSTFLKQKCTIIFDEEKKKQKKSIEPTCGCNFFIFE